MATRDLEKRIAALEAQQAGAELDWVPLVNGCRRLLGEPEVPHTPKPGCRRARIEDWVWLRDAAAEPENRLNQPAGNNLHELDHR